MNKGLGVIGRGQDGGKDGGRSCMAGEHCVFRHAALVPSEGFGVPMCKWFLSEAGCKLGESCRGSHPSGWLAAKHWTDSGVELLPRPAAWQEPAAMQPPPTP